MEEANFIEHALNTGFDIMQLMGYGMEQGLHMECLLQKWAILTP